MKHSNRWKGGRIKRSGYWYIYKPDHPFSQTQGYIAEHRLIMESHIGRYLTHNEVIHHINHVPDDNRIENLELCASAGKHSADHHPDVLEKMRLRNIGKTPWNKGKTNVYSDETLNKMSKSKKGQQAWNKNRPWPIEVKAKISKASKGQRRSLNTEFKKGMTPWNKGKKWSNETKEKMRIAAISRHNKIIPM